MGKQMKHILYHGGTECITRPLCDVGRENLDFGKGFYLTDIKEQAVRWAKAVALRKRKTPVLNLYAFDRDGALRDAQCKIFTAYNAEWLEFIVANRQGRNSESFDYVEGGVADDRVIDTINLYIGGLLDIETTLERLSAYKPSNQICILNQEILDKYLVYYGTESIE